MLHGEQFHGCFPQAPVSHHLLSLRNAGGASCKFLSSSELRAESRAPCSSERPEDMRLE